MANVRRYFPSRKAYFVTNRLAEGLPFVANDYINQMLYGVIARAKSRCPGITLCGFLFLANHYHMLLVLNGDPRQLSDFMNYVDGEIAKLVTRWLGKRNVKIWSQRYHAAIILTPEAALRQMLYMYLNPVKANLVEHAEEWTGCSSFYSLSNSQHKRFKWFKPSQAGQLANGPFTKSRLKFLLRYLDSLERPTFVLPVDPFAWMDCFDDTRGKSVEEAKKNFFGMLQSEENALQRTRINKKCGVAGMKALAEQNPHKHYRPKNFGKRMWCISTCSDLRFAYIEFFKDLCEKAKEVWYAWTSSFRDLPVPHGMFSPPRTPRGSVVFCPI